MGDRPFGFVCPQVYSLSFTLCHMFFQNTARVDFYDLAHSVQCALCGTYTAVTLSVIHVYLCGSSRPIFIFLCPGPTAAVQAIASGPQTWFYSCQGANLPRYFRGCFSVIPATKKIQSTARTCTDVRAPILRIRSLQTLRAIPPLIPRPNLMKATEGP